MGSTCGQRRRRTGLALSVARCAVPVLLVVTTALGAMFAAPASATGGSHAAGATAFPDGVADAQEPSGAAPPLAGALPGYKRTYVYDFGGSSLPPGWTAFSGPAEGDPGSRFAPAHLTISGGLLRLNAWRDPHFDNAWVTGGVCQCGLARTYGAYFVRSRVTGPGPTQVELLWPAAGWPPEVDFDETNGTDARTMATVHFTAQNDVVHRWLSVDMATWHTFGVIWTPSSVTYTVDGRSWAVIDNRAEVPHTAMTLDISQQTWCASGFACPRTDQSTEVDWVAEYSPIHEAKFIVRPFAPGSALLNRAARASVTQLADAIRAGNDDVVRITGYTDSSLPAPLALVTSEAMAVSVELALRHQLAKLNDTDVTITTAGAGSADPAASNATTAGRATNRRVACDIS